MRVLVVEDERRLADGIRLGLEREGFAIDVAYDMAHFELMNTIRSMLDHDPVGQTA